MTTYHDETSVGKQQETTQKEVGVMPASPEDDGTASLQLRAHWSPSNPSRSVFRSNDQPLDHHQPTQSTSQHLENEDLTRGEAPVAREAGMQILKAWQNIERKERKVARLTSVEREEEEEKIFATLEDDDDAIVLSRINKNKSAEDDDDDDEDEEERKEDVEGESEEILVSQILFNGNAAAAAPPSPLRDSPGKEPTRKPTPLKPPQPPPLRPPKPPPQHHNSDETESNKVSIRSGKSLRSGRSLPKNNKKKKKATHRRAESVEQAMFGLLDDSMNSSAKHHSNNINNNNNKRQSKLTQTSSNKKGHPLQDSPLQAAEQLIHTAQTRVQAVQKQQQTQQQKKKQQQQQQKEAKTHSGGRGRTLLDNDDDNNSDEEREKKLNDIINEDGDKVVDNTTVDDDGGHSILNRIDEGDSDEEDDEEEEEETLRDEESGKFKKGNKKKRGRLKRSHHSKLVRDLTTGVQQDWELFQQFLTPRKASMFFYLKIVGIFVVLPSFVIAALLFYLKEFPQQQEMENAGIPIQEDEKPYKSWWFLFLGVRQVITLTMAFITQAILIDYLALGSRFSLKFLGPAVTLLSVQARGWPFVLTLWAIYDLLLLAGDRPLAHHWGYWQDVIHLFNENNHSGKVVQNEWNFRILIIAAVVGVVVAIKRVILGLFLARKTLSHFGEEFENVKKDMIMIGELATLAMEIQIDQRVNLPFSVRPEHTHSVNSMNLKTIKKTLTTYSERSGTSQQDQSAATNAASAANKFVAQWKSGAADNNVNNNNNNNGAPGSVIAVDEGETAELDSLTFVAEDPEDDELEAVEQAEIAELLDEWEGTEDRLERRQAKKITLGSILRFYKEITVMNRRYPFLPVFGRADSRDKCISSAQRLFDRLMLRTPTAKKLPFSTIALLAKDDNDGRMDKEKLRELIRMFRPDRDGKLSKLDFVKSIDSVYRDLRKLNLNIEDSVQIDKAVEFLINIVFYFVLGSIVLQQMGVNPMQVFVSMSSLIIGFAFIFASSSARWFEGILFILVQRPYGVGDRIHLSDPASETSANGASGWVVEKVTLNTTTVYWGATNERATLSNGAIANLRVINAARSPKATIYVHMKFGIDTHYKKIHVFRSAAEQYLKRRPREWCAFIGFRPNDVAIERGYIGYTLIAQHRESWQKIGAILGSKANLTTFMLEVSKQLEMRYLSPPLPVNLKVQDASSALQAVGVKRQDLDRDKSKGSVGTFF